MQVVARWREENPNRRKIKNFSREGRIPGFRNKFESCREKDKKIKLRNKYFKK